MKEFIEVTLKGAVIMHQSYGKLIKLTRIEKNIKQEKLCEGICTPSYLSRIENDRVVADEQVYKLLLQKLEVELNNDMINIEQIDSQIEIWYEQILMNKESSINVESLKEKALTTNADTYLKFKLVYCRHLLISNQLEEVKKYISELEKSIPPFNKRLNFLFANVMIIFYYKNKQFLKAVEAGENFLPIRSSDSFVKPIELGKFYYNLALAYKSSYQYEKSILYGNQALDIFKEWYFLEFALRCHVLLGICYNNSQKYEQAFHSYKVAQEIIPLLPEKDYHYCIIDNNLGNCYENINDYKLSLQHYIKSYENKENDDKMLSLVNIIRCCYKAGNLKQAQYWLEVAEKNIQPSTSNKNIFQLKIFSVVLHNYDLPIEELKKLEEECIQFFTNEKLYNSIIFYSKVFAQLYNERNLYKKVSEMYELALTATEEKISKQLQ
jgi:HTH-type transcriptional regulator, quorum sensing regulator NprR